MIKQISFWVAGLFISLSATAQSINWSIIPEIQQPTYNMYNIEGDFYSTANQTANQRLDSVISYGYEEESEEWNKKLFKISICYDNSYHDTLILQSTWDTTNNSWLHRTKEIKEYDENDHLVTRDFYLISISGKRIQYTYNENGDLIQITESFLNSGEWRFKKRNVYSYNASNLLQADTLYNCYTISGVPEWHRIGITSYNYNNEGNPVADTTYIRPWVKENTFGDWELYSKTAHAYRLNENAKETTFSRWNKDSATFSHSSRELTHYHTDGISISARIDFEWNKAHQHWDTTSMKQYTYDNNDFISHYATQTWGDQLSWVQDKFAYDYSISNDELLLPSSPLNANEKIAFHHKIISKESVRYDYEENEKKKFRETLYYYSEIENDTLTTVYNIPEDNVSVYPNPAAESITINFPHSSQEAVIELFEINGRKILSKPVANGESINISALVKGFYVYSIRFNDEILTGKLLVK